MSIWLLLLILASPLTGLNTSYLLEKYVSAEECYSEATRIEAEMRTAYPDDPSIKIVCRERIDLPIDDPENDPSNPKKEM